MKPAIFSSEYLRHLVELPQVLAAKDRLTTNQVYFTIPVTDTIRSALAPLGLDLTQSEIPMRWIKGDTPPHIDSGPSAFENTYLVYLTDSPGSFLLGDSSFPITANTAFVFTEGTKHATEGTGTVPRLLLGPMNEFAQAVGIPAITYYSNYSDAFTQTGVSLGSGGYTIGTDTYGVTPYSSWGVTSWRIASWTDQGAQLPGEPPSGVYSTGFDVSTFGNYSYFLYPANPCFLEGTTVLCQIDGKDAYVPIETIQRGTLVSTPQGYKKVELIGKATMFNRGDDERVQDRLYKCSVQNYPQLQEDLFLTGCHSILVPKLTDTQRRKTEEILKDIFVTGNTYRLLACIDERAEPWTSEGTHTIWHLALENKDLKKNYGIYVNGGLLVETCCLERMKNNSNLVLC
jgi:hypothetical protein